MTQVSTPATTAASTTLLNAFKTGLLATLPVLAPAIGQAVQPLIKEFGTGVAKAFGLTDADTATKVDAALVAVGIAVGAIIAGKLGGQTATVVNEIAAGAATTPA